MMWLEYCLNLVVLVSLYQILCHSFRFHFGLGRLLNLAHVSVYAIGAYATALLAVELHLGFLACFSLSVLLGGFFALLLGAISLKLSEEYFALGTIAFSAIVTALLINWRSLTRGVLGIPGIPRPKFGGVSFVESVPFAVLVAVVALFSLAFFYAMDRSRFSRELTAQCENEWAALALGKDAARIRRDAFVLSSMFAGGAGSLFSYYITYIDPTSFLLAEMIFLLSVVVVGGPRSFWGVTGATVFLVLLPEALRFTTFDSTVLGPMRQLLYAVILFFVVFLRRHTLFPNERRV